MTRDILRAVLDSLTDPIVVLGAVRDETGQIVDFIYRDANEAACQDDRLAYDDLIGRRLLELYPHHGPSGLLARYAAVAESGEPLLLNNQRYEHEFYTGQDTFFDIRCVRVEEDCITLTWRDVSDRHRTREELRGSEARFRNLAEHASDVVYFAGTDQVIRWASPSVTSVLGWELDEVVGKRGADFVHPDDRAGTDPDRERLFGEDDSASIVSAAPVRIATKSGDYRWMVGSLNRVPAEGTEPGGVVASLRDVDDLVRARRRADEDRERAEATVASLMDPHVVLTSVRDAEGRITDFVFAEANPAACAFNGLRHEELIGRRFLTPHQVSGARELLEAYTDVVETGQPLVRDDWFGPGELPGASRWFDMRAVRLGDGVSVTWRDVTERHDAAEALAQSEARFRMLAENSTDVVIEVDATGAITWVTPSVERVLGWAPEHLIGRPGPELIDDHDLQWLRANRLQAKSGFVQARTAGGGLLPVSLRISLLGDPSQPSGAVVGMTDVSELVAARDEARESAAAEARTRLSMDEAAIGLFVADVDGVISYANPRLHRMFGTPDGSIVGATLETASTPEDLPRVRAALRRVAEGESGSEHLRRRLQDLAGNELWLDTYLSPIRGSDGSVDGVLGQLIDVTAEVANRESLARSMDHFRLLAENASDVVYETNTQGFIVWISPSVRQALGWQPEALVGTRAIDLVHPDDLPAVQEIRGRVYQGEERRNVACRFRTLHGADRSMLVSARPLHGDRGVVTGAVVGLRDVTDEVAATRALERSERLFRVALEEAPAGMALADPDDVLIEANPALGRMLGRQPEELEGHRLRDFLRRGDEADPTCAEILVATGETRIENHEHAVLDESCATQWIAHSVAVVRDRAGDPLFFIHQVTDITASKHREADLGYRASHDLLTGLLNREGLMSRLTEWMPDDMDSTRLALLYCDVDRLKDVNDGHGHAAGDVVLTEAAHRMRTAVRRGDIVARISGDEFVIVLDRIQDEADALAVAEKVRAEVHGPVAVPDGEVLITISVGVAVSASGETAQDVVAHADEALYRAKVAGRDRVCT